MDHIEGFLMTSKEAIQSILNIIKANQESYYSYITGYKNPRESVLNYMICEDLRKSFTGLTVETDIKIKVNDKNRYIDIILYKNNNPFIYLLVRREYGKNNVPIEKDTRKVEFLTSKMH